MMGIEEKEEEVIALAKRILLVYGDGKTPTLDREIRRMASILDIPITEVIKSG